MKIVVAVRCYNEERHIKRFLRQYDFADQIVVSDGGSTDDSVSILKKHEGDKVKVIHYAHQETIEGHTWNEDSGHMNYVLDAGKALNPDWLIFDDMDCNPNRFLRDNARALLADIQLPQVNVFRLYLWGDTGKFFPKMNDDFNLLYTSLWAWNPKVLDIRADVNIRHGTLIGLHPEPYNIRPPACLLHRSWYPETIDKKIERYNALGLPMNHPFEFAGELKELPAWAME